MTSQAAKNAARLRTVSTSADLVTATNSPTTKPLADFLVSIDPTSPDFQAAFSSSTEAWLSNLPTSEPSGPGKAWNNNGVLTVTPGTRAAPTLNALTLSSNEVMDNVPAGTDVGTILGTTSGSTLALDDTLDGKFALDTALGKIKTGATALVAGNYTLTGTETLSGATNSPRPFSFPINVTASAVTSTGQLYDEQFSGTSLPAPWSGSSYGAPPTYPQTIPSTDHLSVSGGDLIIAVTSGTEMWANAYMPLAGLGYGAGDTIRVDIPYDVSAGGEFFCRVTTSPIGANTFVLEGSNLAGAGTFTQSFVVPGGAPPLYLFVYNNADVTSTVKVSRVTLTTTALGSGTPVGGGSDGSSPNAGNEFITVLSSKYITSFAGRGTVEHRLATTEATTPSIVAGLDASECTLSHNASPARPGWWLSHPTGATDKQVKIRWTLNSDTSKTFDLVHVYKQRAAIGTQSGLMLYPAYCSFADNVPLSAVDMNSGEMWAIFSVTPDATGKLNTGPTSYWGYGPNWAPQVASKAHAAGKLVILGFGGGGTWDENNMSVKLAIATPASRAQLVTDLLAEADRIGADGVDFDIENAGGLGAYAFTVDLSLAYLDLVRRMREARPTFYISCCMNGIILRGTQGSDFYGMPDIWPSIVGYLDHGLAMDYSMDLNDDPSNRTWYSSPVSGALLRYHRLDLTTLCDFYELNGIPLGKVVLGGTMMGGYNKGATGPDQPAWVNGVGNGGFWDQTDSYGKIFTYYTPGTNYYDTERKASFRLVTPPKSDGITYISFERVQDWADRREFMKARGLLGINIWTVGNATDQSYLAGCHAAITTNATPPSPTPNYSAGTLVTTVSFPTDTSSNPAGWTAWSNIGYFAEDPNALQVVSNKLRVQSRAGHRQPQAFYDLTGLTRGHLYAVFLPLTVDGSANLKLASYDSSGGKVDEVPVPAGTTSGGYLFKLWATDPTMTLGILNDTLADSTVDVGTFTVRDVPFITTG
jgi:hypothetical protein